MTSDPFSGSPAAAIGTLRILSALDDEVCEDTIDFLAEMQTDEGGLRANTRIPIADLLSTFTGTLTLIDLNGLSEIDTTGALRFAQSMELEQGGFHGAAWDEASDVEYTFYGIGNEKVTGTNGTVVSTGRLVVWAYGNAEISVWMAEWGLGRDFGLRREIRCVREARAYRHHALDRRAFVLRR